MNIKTFTVNGFAVNSFLLFDDTHEGVIIDPGFNEDAEFERFYRFIDENGIKPVRVLNTHCHVDHILGNKAVCEHFGIPLSIHGEDQFLLKRAPEMGKVFGFNVQASPTVESYLNDGDMIVFGRSEIKVLHTPGHSPGSVSFYSKKEAFVISGDLLFAGSIGRTDFPGGNYETIISSIISKLMNMPRETAVFPGHGPSTTIGHEHDTNPFLQ